MKREDKCGHAGEGRGPSLIVKVDCKGLAKAIAEELERRWGRQLWELLELDKKKPTTGTQRGSIGGERERGPAG